MKTRKIFPIFIIITIISILFTSCNDKKADGTEQTSEQSKEIYTCPMHPSVVSDRAGACPVCHMDLVKKSAQQEASDAELSHLEAVSLSPTQRIIANVSTSTVERRDISKGVDAVGVVDVAEPLQAKVTARFRGRIEKLYVNFTGKIVKKGQPLFELYSPDLISAQQELILALKTVQKSETASSIQKEILQASRDRLRLPFGITDEQISEIESTQKLKSSVTFYSPISGTVMAKEIQEGQYIDEGMLLYQLADLSIVWIYLDVYEKDIKDVKLHQSVKITSEAYPNEIFSGKVTFIDPSINPETRTIRVRTEFKNPNGKLKPQMFVKATILETTKKALTIPASAVIYTGKRNVVWVEIQSNIFEPRDVVLGSTAGTLVEVLQGLSEGESVVTTGGYLIDSESQLQNTGAPSGHEGHQRGVEKNTMTEDDTQLSNEVTIVVDGGYSPSNIQVRKGQKLTIHFKRHDDIKCTDEVVFPDFKIKKYLTPHKTTTIEITPKQAGEYRFHCGMDMLEGRIVVK